MNMEILEDLKIHQIFWEALFNTVFTKMLIYIFNGLNISLIRFMFKIVRPYFIIR